MVCYSETREECDSAPPCADGDCPATDSACEPVTESGCVPRYVLPCEADADCGVGFTCEVEEECACSGGGSSGGSAGAGSGADPAPDEKAAPDGGGADPVPPADGSGATPDGGTPTPPECVCTPTDRKSCSLKIVACSVDEGCPAGWTCGDNPNGVCWSNADGTSGCSADPAKICLPPYSDVIGGGRGAVEDGEGTSTGGGLGVDPTPPKGDDGSGAPANGSDPSASDDSGSSDGCAIGHAPRAWHATFGFAALALAGLLGARRRRSR
jgi:MYXO-CTERM domain-containing protein